MVCPKASRAGLFCLT